MGRTAKPLTLETLYEHRNLLNENWQETLLKFASIHATGYRSLVKSQTLTSRELQSLLEGHTVQTAEQTNMLCDQVDSQGASLLLVQRWDQLENMHRKRLLVICKPTNQVLEKVLQTGSNPEKTALLANLALTPKQSMKIYETLTQGQDVGCGLNGKLAQNVVQDALQRASRRSDNRRREQIMDLICGNYPKESKKTLFREIGYAELKDPRLNKKLLLGLLGRSWLTREEIEVIWAKRNLLIEPAYLVRRALFSNQSLTSPIASKLASQYNYGERQQYYTEYRELGNRAYHGPNINGRRIATIKDANALNKFAELVLGPRYNYVHLYAMEKLAQRRYTSNNRWTNSPVEVIRRETTGIEGKFLLWRITHAYKEETSNKPPEFAKRSAKTLLEADLGTQGRETVLKLLSSAPMSLTRLVDIAQKL